MSIIRSILSVALLVTIASAGPLVKNNPNTIVRADPPPTYRLPNTVFPTAYVIELTPNIVEDDFTFTGISVIDITLKKATQQIIFHARDLEFVKDSTTLTENKIETPKTYKPAEPTIDTVTDFVTLTFTDEIPAGNYKLTLKYKGKLHDDLNGFYRSSYKNEKGELVYLATTQFEPTHARRAFPCFDEPALKATFQITIVHEDKYRVRSNTLVESSKGVVGSPSKLATTFKVTPKMSTYLVAFIISDFESLTNKDGKFRVWSRRNALETGKYAHGVGEKELEELEQYTGIKIPDSIGKMDNFAIPQFRAGAMENWGIVTYRESALLFEEGVSTTAAKKSIATVISHEFAHQWFGNLVGPAWWKYTWLNEGFASYFQYLITDKVETKWRLMEQFVIESLQRTAFVADDDATQHPMNFEVNSPAEISKIFDSISYQKAGCVIRMFSHALTETLFKKGLTAYLNGKKMDTATSDDLFQALAVNAPGAAGDLKLVEVMNSWATQAGFPVIKVTLDPKTGKATIVQKRFLSKKLTSPPAEKWYIPITYATEEDLKFSETKPSHWLKNEESQEITLTGVKEKQWVIFNNQQTGYYRVNYDDANWDLITEYINTDKYTKIPAVNRAQLLDDSFHLAKAGEHENFKVFLGLSRYLQQEVDYVPWYAAFRAFSDLNRALANTANYELFQLYVLRLTNNLELSLNYTEVDGEDQVTKFNRVNAINWSCLMGSKQCKEATLARLEEHITTETKISPDLRSAIFCAGIRDAEETTWNNVYKYYESSKNTEERNALLNGLGCSSDTKILNSYLEKTIEENATLSVKTVLEAVSSSSASGINVALDFISAKYQAIYDLDEAKKTIVDSLKTIAPRLTTPDQHDKLKKLTEDHSDIKADLTESLAKVETNVAWVKDNEKHIATFLNDQKLVDPPKEEETKDDGNASPRMSLPTISFTIFLALVAPFVSLIQ